MPLIAPIILLIVAKKVLGIAIDNGLENGPIVECGAGAVRIGFETRNSFYGRVYIKGASNDERCKRKGNGIDNSISIEIPFENCNLARIRSLSPKGIYVTTTIVISFHPYFLTKTDHAYRIQCLYLETEKFVTANLGVRDATNAQHIQSLPMPICRYEVYHKWSCDSPLKNTYCMLVYSCVVDDGNGDKILILDAQGCAVDRFLLGNLEYPGDLTAGKEAHVYKYADKEMLFFECRISISVRKEKHMECPRPQCPEPNGFVSVKKNSNEKTVEMKKRSIRENTVDVRTELYALDLSFDMLLKEFEKHLNSQTNSILLQKMTLSSFAFFILFTLIILILMRFFCNK